MKSYKRMGLISAVILVCLGCLGAAAWLAFEGLLNDRNWKIETGKSKLENRGWRLTHEGFPTTSSSGPANLVADNVGSRFQPSPPWGRGWTASRRTSSGGGPGEGVQAQARVVESYGRMPLSFEANAGQTDPRVKFLSRGAGYTLFLTGDEAVLALKKSGVRSQESEAGRAKLRIGKSKFEIGNWKFENRRSKIDNRKSAIGNRQSTIDTAIAIPRPLIPNLEVPIRVSEARTSGAESRESSVLRLKLWGANPAAKVTGAEELPGKANYFIGNDPKKWHTNVPTYAKVRYQDVYRGVDLVYHGNQSGQLEYDFVVAPGADAGAIALEVAAGLSRQPSRKNGGVKPPLQIAAEGDLVIPTDGGELRFHKPVVYQEQLTVDS